MKPSECVLYVIVIGDKLDVPQHIATIYSRASWENNAMVRVSTCLYQDDSLRCIAIYTLKFLTMFRHLFLTKHQYVLMGKFIIVKRSMRNEFTSSKSELKEKVSHARPKYPNVEQIPIWVSLRTCLWSERSPTIFGGGSMIVQTNVNGKYLSQNICIEASVYGISCRK